MNVDKRYRLPLSITVSGSAIVESHSSSNIDITTCKRRVVKKVVKESLTSSPLHPFLFVFITPPNLLIVSPLLVIITIGSYHD